MRLLPRCAPALVIGAALAFALGNAGAQEKQKGSGSESGNSITSRSFHETHIAEMIRKAEAHEKEDGFCTQVGWPRFAGGADAFTVYLKAAKVGTWKVNTFDNGNCQYDRVTSITPENGGKCIAYTYWACDKGGTCGISKASDCLDSKGVFTTRK
jgi:hypothetical protein